ncbi:MAG: hypothetical protein IPP48_08735 [Chitinophagaceae bacterium]|nr:hypothetical protein [Chitinophagaceae bacterium]
MKIILLLFLFPLTLDLHSQSKNKIGVELGLSYRQALIELKNYPYRTTGRYYNQMGYIFEGITPLSRVFMPTICINYLFNNKNRLQVSNYFYKNYLATLLDSNNKVKERIKAFKYDGFIDFVHGLKNRKGKNINFEFGAGLGVMNISKSFSYTDYEGKVENGLFIRVARTMNQKPIIFFAPRVIIGVEYKKMRGQIITYITPDEDLDNKISLWFEGKLSYSFFLFK